MPRRPKIAPTPDVQTTPSLQLLALVVKAAKHLSYDALGELLGMSERAAALLCLGGHSTNDQAVVSCRNDMLAPKLYHHAAAALLLPRQHVEDWAALPPRDRRGLGVTAAVAAVFDDGNELRRLHRQAVARNPAFTVQHFADALRISRQRLHVLETTGRPGQRGYDRAVEAARRLLG